MSLSWQRRLGAIVLVVLLLSSILVPAASAGGPNKNDPNWGNAPASGGPHYGCAVYYRVRKGDNLTIISRRYGVSVWQMQQWNNIWNPDRIYLGQTLVIYRPCPRPQPPPPPPAPKPLPCGRCIPPPVYSTWFGTYYSNRDLSGSPVYEQTVSGINFNWGWGSPASCVPVDNFSARWTNTSNESGGNYLISVRTDDGARVYIDGNLVLSAWQIQSVATYQVQVYLSPGQHTYVVEYFEAEALAEISFSITRM